MYDGKLLNSKLCESQAAADRKSLSAAFFCLDQWCSVRLPAAVRSLERPGPVGDWFTFSGAPYSMPGPATDSLLNDALFK